MSDALDAVEAELREWCRVDGQAKSHWNDLCPPEDEPGRLAAWETRTALADAATIDLLAAKVRALRLLEGGER